MIRVAMAGHAGEGEDERFWFGYYGLQLNEHIQPVVDFYEARGKPEEAARYRAMLALPIPPPPGRE